LPGSGAALSHKHTLALTNRGAATGDELLALARHIRDGVRERFDIELTPEPSLLDAQGGLVAL
jgi:UDP-N-acetylmuramate dehydrogenase